jgi:plastocyanin
MLGSRRNLMRGAFGIAAAGALVLAMSGGAAAGPAAHGQHLSSKNGVIVAKGHGINLSYSSTTVRRGHKLRIVNRTGDVHTLSLVQPRLVPRSDGQIKNCFHKGHICRSIAGWHKFDGQNINRNPVRAGRHGWDREGNNHRLGDSVFYGGPAPNPNSRRVTAPAGTVLHFICAIHPWMRGTITVK